MSKFNKFGDLVARVAIAVFVGGGLYGFFGPNRQMGCDGVIGVGRYYGWISRNLLCPTFSALIYMVAIVLWMAAIFGVLIFVKDKLEK